MRATRTFLWVLLAMGETSYQLSYSSVRGEVSYPPGLARSLQEGIFTLDDTRRARSSIEEGQGAASNRPRRGASPPSPQGWLRPVPRYMWEMYHRFLSSDASCRSFVSLPNLGVAAQGCDRGEVVFDLSSEGGEDLVSAHLHVELHPRGVQGLHANASALLEVTVALHNTSLTEVVRIGDDAVFELTREVRSWYDGGVSSRLFVSVRPLDASPGGLDGSSPGHRSADRKEAQTETQCSTLTWEASLMISREDRDSCRISGPSETMEEEGNVIPKEWYSSRRSRREAERGGRMKRNGCRVKRLYVNFRDIGWDAWIIAPAGYEAGSCRGRCSFPLQALHAPTNHALVMVLLRELLQKGGGASCVPYEMEPLSLLYYDHGSNVVLRKHPEMVVRRCGCR